MSKCFIAGRRCAIMIVAAIMAVCAPTAGIAQDIAFEESPQLQHARETIWHVIGCMSAVSRGTSRKLIDIPPEDPRFGQVIGRVAGEITCFHDLYGAPLDTVVVRGHLMGFAYWDKSDRPQPEAWAVAPPVDYAALHATAASGVTPYLIAIEQFGDCIARYDAAGALRVIAVRPGSQKEADALAALRPAYAACAAKAPAFRLSLSGVRAGIANAIYRLSTSVSGRGDTVPDLSKLSEGHP